MYNVLLTNRALKDIKKIDRKIVKFILTKIEDYSKDPYQHSKKLVDPKIGT